MSAAQQTPGALMKVGAWQAIGAGLVALGAGAAWYMLTNRPKPASTGAAATSGGCGCGCGGKAG